jgi:RimJ/RimL family protein N-acetyltransferase
VIETARLRLRPPRAADRAALHAMWADPLVMADLGPVKSAREADMALARHAGYAPLGFDAVVRRADDAVIGFCGLKPGAPDTPIADEVEAGWALLRAYWRQGYALEAMRAVLDDAWRRTAAPRIVAITAACNDASQALMRRLGMAPLPGGTFDHPAFAPGDRLRPTVTYAIDRPA